MPVRHRQQHPKIKLLTKKFILYPISFGHFNLDKAFHFGKRPAYTFFLKLAIEYFYI